MEIIGAYVHRTPKRKSIYEKEELAQPKKMKIVQNDPLSSTFFDSTDSVFI